MLIYLIGYMGCGKTTAGEKLASRLGYEFIDLDSVIEKEQNQTISEIFKTKGQDAFRLMEREALKKTFSLTDTIVSTGGGAPCFFNNMDEMNKHGKTIYIELTPKALVSRLVSAKDKRPLISEKSDIDLLVFIKEELAKREPFYNKSQLKISGLGLIPKTIEELIF